MPKRAAKSKSAAADRTPAPWAATLTGLLFLLVQIVLLPGATSAFRLPKEALAAAGIGAIVALGVSVRLRGGDLPLARGPLALTLVALPALQALSSLWAADPRRALASAAVTACWVVAAFWLASLTAVERERVVTLTAIGTTISAVVLLLQAAGLPLLVLGVSEGSRFRMSGLAGNPADLSTSALLLLPLLLVGAAKHPGSWWRWVVTAVLVTAAVVSQTFTGYIALGLVTLLWLMQRRSARLWAAAAAIAAVAIAVALGAGLGDRVRRQLRQIELGDWYSVMSARSDGWTAAAEMIHEHPLLGVGAGHFDHAYYPSRLAWLERRGAIGRRGELATHFEWAHCDPLQMVAELGTLGGIWMLGLAWALARGRPRGDPLPLLAAAVAAPFLALHYPTHLAVGMVPIALVLGHLLAAQPHWRAPRLRGGWRVAVPVALAAVAVAGVSWQLRRVALDVWRADLERRLVIAYSLQDPSQRAQLAATVESQVLPRVGRLPGAAPWLWRIVGKARLTRDDPRAAEQAFRTASELWLHEEADMGLGLALAGQGRRSEALVPLGRVCRVNPAVARQIQDPDLRRAVQDLTRARRRASGR